MPEKSKSDKMQKKSVKINTEKNVSDSKHDATETESGTRNPGSMSPTMNPPPPPAAPPPIPDDSDHGYIIADVEANQQQVVAIHPILHVLNVARFWLGFCCRGEPLTDKGKRMQLVKVLSLTLLPIMGLWVFTVHSLNDSIEGKFDIEQTQSAVKFSVEIGIFLDRIQRERDMSVLYLSILGPETKTFLLNEYILTDEALEHLSRWPVINEFNTVFRSKQSFGNYLKDHRNKLDPNDFNIYATMDFYNGLIERFVEWMYGSIKESSMASIWKVLVAYQKIVTGMEHIGIERALGTVFYVEGGLHQTYYKSYNNRVNIYKANYRSAVLYSKIVDPIFQQGVTSSGTNLTAVIESFRFEIQHSKLVEPSITKGQWWFDNMTMYLDRLLLIQQELATFINGELQNIIDEEDRNLTISACFLVFVIFMCPLVIYSVEALTSDIQKYAIAMTDKTKELAREKEKIDTLLYQMVPAVVADRLKQSKEANAEYFKSVTVLFFDIDGFVTILKECSPLEIVNLLNALYTEIDIELDNHEEVYKVETINDSYMVASGLPTRNGSRHSAAIAHLALTLVEMMVKRVFTAGRHCRIRLRIGIDTGPCMAGTVGRTLPRYCLFGDTINTASRMKSYSLPNQIHLSNCGASALKKHSVFIVKYRGTIEVKGKGKMRTFWLTGKMDKTQSSLRGLIDNKQNSMSGLDPSASVDESNVMETNIIQPKQQQLQQQQQQQQQQQTVGEVQKGFFDNVWSNNYYMQEDSVNRYTGATPPTDETFSNFQTPADELQDSSRYLNRRGALRQVSCDSTTDGSQQEEDKRGYTGPASGGPSGSLGGPNMPTIREAWQTSDDSESPSLKKGEGKKSLLRKRSSSGSMSRAKQLAESIAEHEAEPEGAESKEGLVSLSSGGGKEKGLFRQKAVPDSNPSPTVEKTNKTRLASLSESEVEFGKEEAVAAEEVGMEEEEEKAKEEGTEEKGTGEAGGKQEEEEEPPGGRSMSRSSSLAGDDIRKSITQLKESKNRKSSLPETNNTSEPSDGSQQKEGAPQNEGAPCQSHSSARLDWELKQHYWFLHYSQRGKDRDTYPRGESAVSAGGKKSVGEPGGATKEQGERPRPNISPSKAEAIAGSLSPRFSGEKGVNPTPTNSPSQSPGNSRSTSRTEEPARKVSHASKKQPSDSMQAQSESCEGLDQTPEVSPPVAEPEVTPVLDQPPDDGDGGSSACAPGSVDLQTPDIILTASTPPTPSPLVEAFAESTDVLQFEGDQQNTSVSDGDQASASTRPAKGAELDDEEDSVIPLDMEQAQVLGSEIELALKNAEPRAASAPGVIERAGTGSDTLQDVNHASVDTPTSLTTPEDKPATSSKSDPALSIDLGNGSVPVVIVSSPLATPSPSPSPSPAPPAKPAASPRKGIAASPNAVKRSAPVSAGAKGQAKTKAKSTAAVAPYCVVKQPASKAASRGVGPVSATSGAVSVSAEGVPAVNASTATSSVTARDAPRVSFTQDEATVGDKMAQRSSAMDEPQA